MKASVTVDIDASAERVWAVMSEVEAAMDAVCQVYSTSGSGSATGGRPQPHQAAPATPHHLDCC